MKKIIFYVSICIGCVGIFFSQDVIASSGHIRVGVDSYIGNDITKAQQTMGLLLTRVDQETLSLKEKYLFSDLITHVDSTYFNIHQGIHDTSVTRYVGPTSSYTNKLYTPHDLSPIQATKYLTIHPALPLSQYQLRQAVHEPLNFLARAYMDRFGQPLHINSAWRSYHEQQNRFSKACFAEGICALPGTSEHQNGFTIDIAHMYGEQYKRMKTHAHLYGFHQSYQKGKEVDGLQVEPWHRRWVGSTLAGYLYEENLSFTERFRLQ